MLCVPVWNRDRISYLAVPLGYRMWPKKESKLELASAMVRQVRPAKYGRRLSIDSDFDLSDEKAGDYYIGCHRVLTNIFGTREVMAYVTSTGKERAPLNQTGSGWMPYIPLFLYSFRWNTEVSYYEQKSFWSLCACMVRSRYHRIERNRSLFPSKR